MAGLTLGLGLGLHRGRTGGGAAAPLQISGTPVLTANEDAPYTGFTATASGGVAPYTYSLVGTWPAGISVNSSTGEVSGTPTASGSFAGLSVRVTDAASDTADLSSFTLTVEAAASWQTSVSLTPTIDSPGWSGYTLRQRANTVIISNTGGSKVRVTLLASAAGGFVLANAYIGHAAAAGDAYDYEAAPTQLTFGGGSAGATVGAGSTLLSDEITFTIQPGKPLLISLYFSGTSAIKQNNSASGDARSYYKFANDAATVDASGYTSHTYAAAVSLVESLV